MSSNMKSTNSAYEDAANEYNKLAKKFSSGEMYNQAVQQGQNTAMLQGQQAANQVRQAGLNAGMSKGQMVGMAGNAAANTTANTMQQNIANSMGAMTTGMQGQQNYMAGQQQEGANRYNRSWGNLTGGASMAGSVLASFSDERTKDASKNNEETEDSGIEAILKRHQRKPEVSFKSLLIKENK